MIQTLHTDTSLEAIQFGETLFEDGLWTAKSKKAEERLDRAQVIFTLAEMLRIEHIVAADNAVKRGAVEILLSELALELSDLSKAAIADKSLRTIHFDPWVMTNPIDNDPCNRLANLN